MSSSFQYHKEKALRKLHEALLRQEVDEPIIEYLEVINSKEEYYTTSSCYGRITVDCVPLIDNKKEHTWIGKWHRTVKKEEILESLNRGYKNITYIKQEPFILHIGAKDIESAEKLLHVARNELGLKRSGIMHTKPRIILEIMGLDFISLPAKIEDKYLIKLEELEGLVQILNTKFKRNEERLKKLIKKIEKI